MRYAIVLLLPLLLGGADVQINPALPVMQIDSLQASKILDVPLTSGYKQSATVVSDTSGKGLHMTLVGSPTIDATGATCNGTTSYLQNTTENWGSSDQSGCVSLWFKTSTNQNKEIFTTSDASSATGYLRLKIHDTTGGVLQIDQDEGAQRDIVRATTTTGLADGAWHHAVYCTSGSAYSIAVDTVTQSLSVILGSNSGDWFADVPNRDRNTICALDFNGAGASSFFNGSVVDIRAFNRVLSAPEILRFYTQGPDGNNVQISSLYQGRVLDIPALVQ